jgi:hypothetical protein
MRPMTANTTRSRHPGVTEYQLVRGSVSLPTERHTSVESWRSRSHFATSQSLRERLSITLGTAVPPKGEGVDA